MWDLSIQQCPICHQQMAKLKPRPDFIDGEEVECPNCGVFQLAGSLREIVKGLDVKTRASLSHMIFVYWDRNLEPCPVSHSKVQNARLEIGPDPAEQLEQLILFLGSHQQSPGTQISLKAGCLRAKVAAVDEKTEEFLLEAAKLGGLVELKGTTFETICVRLTLGGWQQYHELLRKSVYSTHAFMAMPFGYPKITTFVDTVFRPAVAETGFTLKRLDDAPEAGVIDNRMRVEIRQSKFVIADLTHCNRGAYWEAGFAEGLGKPVIYTCEKSYFDAEKTHFDTNHCTTVLWDAAEPEKAAEQLKATIRNTFPIEAIMRCESTEDGR